MLFVEPAAPAGAQEARVLICPFQNTSDKDLDQISAAIAHLLPSRVAVPGKLRPVEGDGKACAPYQGSAARLTQSCAFAKKSGADFLLTGTVTRIGQAISIDARVLDASACAEPESVFVQTPGVDAVIPELTALGRKIQQVILAGPAQPAPAAPAAAQPGTAPPAQPLHDPLAGGARYARPDELPVVVEQNSAGAQFAARPFLVEYVRSIPLQRLAIGDVNGDGRDDLVAAGGNEIHLLAFNGSALKEFQQVKAQTGGSIVHIDAADLNGTPPAELYVSSFAARSADSSILEYRNKAVAPLLTNLPWFFRVLTGPDGRAELIGQDARLNNPFGGAIHTLSWQQGALAPGAAYGAPAGTNVYGFAACAVAEAPWAVFTANVLSSDYSLKLVSPRGKELWRDRESLGGSPHTFKRHMFADESKVDEPVPLRILAGASQGRPWLIVARNFKKGQKFIRELVNYNQGEVLCLVWNGGGFDVNWRSGYLNGHVSDYVLGDVDGDGNTDLAVLSSTGAGGEGRAVNKVSVFRRIAGE